MLIRCVLVCFFSIKLTYESIITLESNFVKTFLLFLVNYFFVLERNTDMTTFERIKKLAKQKDKSLQQVARELKYGENYFYSLNAGKQPTAEKLQEIANYFNVSVDYLLGRTDNPNSDSLEEDEITTFFRVNTEDLTESEKDQLREELKEYLEFMKSRLKNK